MVGGKVIETIEIEGNVWINVEGTGCEEGEQCAIYVEADAKARSVSEGDRIWWQGDSAYWTPRRVYQSQEGEEGTDWDIKLKRRGYSGVKRPEPSLA